MRVNTRETPRAVPAKPAKLTVVKDGAHSTVVGGSTAGLRLACTASRLEENRAGRSTNKWADRGTALHHIMEEALLEDMDHAAVLRAWAGVSIGPEGKVQLPDSDMVFTIDITADLLKTKVQPALDYFDKIMHPSAKFLVEQKVGFFVPDDVPDVGYDDIRDASFESVDGAFGTADVTAKKLLDPKSNRYLPGVLDWKFGDGYLVPAENNDQMRFYLVGAIMTGILPVVPEYVAHIFQPADSMHPDEFGSSAVYTLEDLVRFNNELADAIKADPVHTVGAHCAKCNGRMVCKAFQDTLTTAVMTDVPGMSAKDLAQQLRLLGAYKKFIEDVAAAALRNAQAGVDIPGYVLEPAQGNSAWRDGEKAERALGRLGLGVHDRRVVTTVSPTQALKLLGNLGTGERELERFKKQHIFRPDNGEKLVVDKGEGKGNGNPRGAMKRLAAALEARGYGGGK